MKTTLIFIFAALISLNVSAQAKGKSYFGKKADFTVTGELHKNAIMSAIRPENKNDYVLNFHADSKVALEIFKTCQTNGDICEVTGSGYLTKKLKSASMNKIKSVKLIQKGDKEKSLVGFNVTGKVVRSDSNTTIKTDGGYQASFQTNSKVGEKVFATCKADTSCKITGQALKDDTLKVYNIDSIDHIELSN